MVKFGAGAMWKQVLDVVDPKKYTMIHGNVSQLTNPYNISTNAVSTNAVFQFYLNEIK